MTDRTPTEATWKLVPTEPTAEMIEAHFKAHAEAETVFAEVPDIWRAMLAASPPAPAAEPVALGPRPCDCERCDCGNVSDAQAVAAWDERAASTHPIDAAAIRAEARKAALEEVAAYHDEEAESYHKLYLGNIRARNEEKAARCQERVQWHRAQAGAIRALADKGEAE